MSPDIVEVHVWNEDRSDCIAELTFYKPSEGFEYIDSNDLHPFDSEVLWSCCELVEVIHVTV